MTPAAPPPPTTDRGPSPTRLPGAAATPHRPPDRHRAGTDRPAQAWSRPARQAGPRRCVGAWWRAERGSAAVELTLVAPLLILLLVLVGVLVHRGVTARIELDAAAHQAARAATLARTVPAAHQAANTAARDALTTAGPGCLTTDVAVDTSRWRPGGTVTITLSCRLDLAAAVGFGLGGDRVLTATAVEPLDSFRGTTMPITDIP